MPSKKLPPEMLELLVCPLTKQPLTYDEENNILISESANLVYPIIGGIPIMLPEKAKKLDD